MSETATNAALAELFGVTDRTIRDLAMRGIIVRAGRGYGTRVIRVSLAMPSLLNTSTK